MIVWTLEKNIQLASLYHSGKTATEIANVFGTTRNAICGRLYRMHERGLPRRDPVFRAGEPKVRAVRVWVRKEREKAIKEPKVVKMKQVSKAKKVIAYQASAILSDQFRNTPKERCRFIIGDYPHGFDMSMAQVCEEMAEYNKPYCTHHRKICGKAA